MVNGLHHESLLPLSLFKWRFVVNALAHVVLASMSPKAKRQYRQYEDPQLFRKAHRRIHSDYHQVNTELRRLEKIQQRRAEQERPGIGSVSQCLKWILLMLYVLGGYSVVCAESYWVQQRKKRKKPPYSSELMTPFIEDLFMAVDNEKIFSTLEEESQQHKFSRLQAFSWFSQHRLRDWVREKNLRKGLAVPSRYLTEHYNKLLQDIPFEIRLHPQDDPRSAGAARVFLWRWRQKFKSKWGRIRVQEHIPLAEKRSKVPKKTTFRSHLDSIQNAKKIQKWFQKQGSKNGPVFGTL